MQGQRSEVHPNCPGRCVSARQHAQNFLRLTLSPSVPVAAFACPAFMSTCTAEVGTAGGMFTLHCKRFNGSAPLALWPLLPSSAQCR